MSSRLLDFGRTPDGVAVYYRPHHGANSVCPRPNAPPGKDCCARSSTTPTPAKPIGSRAAYIWSSEEADSVADARERALTKAEAALIKIRNGLGGRYDKTRKQVDDRVATILDSRPADLLTVTTGPARHGKPTISWHRNPDALTATSQLDGLYAVATNLPDPPGRTLTAQDVLTIYKDQWIVEQRHRDLKQTLHVRPIFLHNDDRIEAVIAVVGIALLVYGLIEADLRHALGPDTTGATSAYSL